MKNNIKDSIFYIDAPSVPGIRWAEITKPQKSYSIDFLDKNNKPFAKIKELLFNGEYFDIIYLQDDTKILQRIRIEGNKLIGNIDFTKSDYLLKIYSNDYCKTIHVKTIKNKFIVKNIKQ